jgi:hypothetical protein
MPKLLAFLPCDRVIIANDNSTSLITLLETMNINVPPGEEEKLPANPQLPRSWQVFTLWEESPGERGQKFTQKLEFVRPDRKDAVQIAIVPVEFTERAKRHRTIVAIPFFPLLPAGTSYVRTLLQLQGQDEWIEYATYPILIERTQHESSNP